MTTEFLRKFKTVTEYRNAVLREDKMSEREFNPETYADPAIPDLGPEGNYPKIVFPAVGDEINAMVTAYSALAPLTEDAKARAVTWLRSVLNAPLDFATLPPAQAPVRSPFATP